MAEGSSDRGSLLSRAPRIGRRLATLLFWCCALYMAAAGFYSIPLQVFQPQANASPPADDCESGVRELRSELLGHASEHVASAGATDAASLDGWLHGWDLRHAALAPICTGGGERAHVALGRMRHRVEDSLVRVTRELAPLSRDVDRGLSNVSSNESRAQR